MPVATDSKSRVLIVDDEPDNIQVLSNILVEDYVLSAATNAKQALDLARTQSPDLILLDMVMPDMDGLAACQALKASEETRDIPVIFVTRLNDPENEERGLQAGAVDYIAKPFSPPIVKARVKIHIQHFQAVRFLETLLSSQTTDLDEVKAQAESLLVFV